MDHSPANSRRLARTVSCPGLSHSHPMVLETKNLNLSYGTLSSQPPLPTPTHRYSPLPNYQRGHSDDDSDGDPARCGLRKSAVVDMTQDLYQRQPLLSSSSMNEGWELNDAGEMSGSDSSGESCNVVYYDVHTIKANGSGVAIRNGHHHINGSNGLVLNGKVTSLINGSAVKNGGVGGCTTGPIGNGGMVRIEVPAPHREEPKFPRETVKTVIGLVFLFTNWFLTTTSLALVHERVPDRTKYGPLPDVFLDNVPAADWALDVSEILIIISSTSCMLLLFFHKYRLIIMRRLFFLLGILYMMRSITMYVTVLPVASTTYVCSPKSNHTSAAVITLRAIRLFLGMGLSINGQHVYCGDYIYSGHTVILTIVYLTIQEYTPRKWYILHWTSWLISTLGVVFVMVAHGHYTVDVLIAYYVTTRLFWMYHTMANNSPLKQRGPSNYFSRLWWFRIFTYFERNVGGVVPRRYEWPLPWPRQFLSKYPDRDS